MLLDRPPYRLASIGPRFKNPLGEVEPPIAFIARARPFPNASAGFRCIGSNVNAHKTRAAAPKREIAGDFFFACGAKGLEKKRSYLGSYLPFSIADTQVVGSYLPYAAVGLELG